MRSLKLRSLQSLVVTALVALGAQGCDPQETGGGTSGDPGPIVCEPGYHVETICDDTCQTPCKDQCVPDEEQCPDGTTPEWVCDPVAQDDIVCDPTMDCPPPPEPECSLQCVPIDICGEGYHEEWVCEGGGGGMEGDPNDPTLPPDQCYPICVPDSVCEPGSHEEWVCEDPGACSHDKCVEGPALQPECDPGVAAICGVDPFCCEASWDSLCVAEVESVAGEQCGPPDQYPPSPPQSCQSVCVPDAPECPPGQHLEEVCNDDGPIDDPEYCELVCVDDGPPEQF